MGSWIGSVVNSQQDDTPNEKHETHPCKIMQTFANQKASQILYHFVNKTLVTFFGFWQVDADSFDRSLASSRGLCVLELRALAAMALRVCGVLPTGLQPSSSA